MIPYRPFCLQFMHRNNEGLNFYFADLKKSKVLDIFNEEAKRREQRPVKSLNHYELLLFKEYAESSNFWDVRFFGNKHILVMATTKHELLLMLNNLYKNGFLDDNDVIEKIKVPFRHVDKFALTKDDSGKDDITYEYCRMNCSGGSSWLRPGYYGQRMEIYSPRGHEMIKPDRRVTKHYMMKQLNPLLKDKRICDEF